MNMKAMMFAGGGLMLSMIVTTMWVGNDMAQIKERARQKQQAACAAQAAMPTSATGAVDQATGAPIQDTGIQQGTGTTRAPAACTATSATASGSNAATTAGSADSSALDPLTGAPIRAANATAAGLDAQYAQDQAASSYDPATGQDTATVDPNTGAVVDPYAGTPSAGY